MAISREEAIAELRRRKQGPIERATGILGRGAVKGLGAIPDILAIPANVALGLQGKEGLPSVSEKLGSYYDTFTGGAHKPAGAGEKSLGTAGEFVAGGAGIGKAAATGASKFASKYLAPKNKMDISSLAGAGIGTELGNELTPGSALGPLAGGLAGGLIPGAAAGSFKGLHDLFVPKKNGADVLQSVGGQPYIEKGAHAQPAIQQLQQKALAEKQPIKQAYESAREQSATAPKREFKDFVPNILRNLEEQGVHLEDAPGITGFLKTVKRETGKPDVSVNALEERRKILNNMIEKSEEHGTKANALQALKRSFDDTWDDIIENSLAHSNEPQHAKVLKEFKNARSLYADWKKKYTTDNPKEFGKKFVNDMIERAESSNEPFTPESIVNRIFGASEMGFQEQTPYIVKELAKHLDDQALQDIEFEGLARIFTPVLKDQYTVSDIRKFKSNWDRFNKENPSLSKEWLKGDKRKEVEKFAAMAASVKDPNVFVSELSKLPFIGRAAEYIFGDIPAASSSILPTAAKSMTNQLHDQTETPISQGITREEAIAELERRALNNQ